MIAPELMGHDAVPSRWKEFPFHRGCSFDRDINPPSTTHRRCKGKKGRATSSPHLTLQTFLGNSPEEEFNNDVSRPRKVFYHGK